VQELRERLQQAVGDAYRIERELPGGGMSRLFVAVEASLNRQVVIKLLPPDATSEVSAQRFRQEVELAARLQHPHILPVLAAGARDGLLYYVMPYVAGESLRARLLREGPLEVDFALRVVAEIADALSTAHAAGVIHRDIKPENILLEGKHAVLADFGIARALAASRTGGPQTATGTAMGTPGYMPPEQIAGDHVGFSADIYALAVVAYELLAGRPPFDGVTAQAILTAHLTDVPTPLVELRPAVGKAASDAIARAMAKSPGDRFSSAAEFGQSLAPEPRVSSGDRPTRRRVGPRAWSAAGVAALIVLGGGLVATLQRGRVSPELAQHLRVLADSGKLDSIAQLLAGRNLRDARLQSLAPRIFGRVQVVASGGVDVTLRRVTPIETYDQRPVQARLRSNGDARRVVAGEYLMEIGVGPTDTLRLLVDVGPGDSANITVAQVPSPGPDGIAMRFVRGGMSVTGEAVQDFFIDREEVTNAAFARFIEAGGYRRPEYWPATMNLGDGAVPREAALARLIDRSGLPGPRHWSGGRPPAGLELHPVVGVTWYEAAAFARWAGKRLPTASEWWRAALGDQDAIFPWGRDGANVYQRANLEGRGTEPASARPLGVSPFGVEHLAGNAREWLADSTPDGNRRIVVGGSWQDPSYMFERSHAEYFTAGYANDAIGFRLVRSNGSR